MTDERSLSEWIIDAENAISREHTMWMAKRIRDPIDIPPGDTHVAMKLRENDARFRPG